MNTDTAAAATARLLATAYADYYRSIHTTDYATRVEARATFYGMAEVAAAVFGTSATDLVTNGATAVREAGLLGGEAAALAAAVLPVYESLLVAAAVAS